MNLFCRHLFPFVLFTSATYALAVGPGVAAPNAKALAPAQQARVAEGYGKLPLSFEPNKGQADPQVKFLSRGDGYSLSLTPSAAVLSLPGKSCASSKIEEMKHPTKKPQPCAASPNSVLRMGLLGSNPDAEIRGEAELPGKSNYFIGQDSSAWHTNISNYGKVRYHGVYPGIDLVYYGNQRRLEHDFIVAPGADPKMIRLSFQGARETTIDADGNLALETEKGSLLLKRPTIYQEIAGVRRAVPGSFVQKNTGEVGFAIGSYDTKQELVIDPILVYSTYFPATPGDAIAAIAADAAGDAYIAEERFNPQTGTEKTIVQKLNADGSAVLYTTTMLDAQTAAIAVDTHGNAYLTGVAGPNLPVVNAFQAKPIGQYNAFVMKLDASGANLLFSTYFGGYETYSTGIAVDALESVYITGQANNEDVPVTTPLSVGTEGAFITKFAPSGQSLEYSTYISGANKNSQNVGFANAIAVDPSGEAIIAGITVSSKFPLVNALHRTCDIKHHPSSSCIFVTKINASGTGLLYSTFFGTGEPGAVATNADGDAFIGGIADSSGFPIVNALNPTTAMSQANFLARINATGSAVVYSTYLGDSIQPGESIAVDGEDTYVTGSTKDGLPVVNAIQGTFGGGPTDGYVLKINGNGSSLLFSTYLGGRDEDQPNRIALDGYGNVYISGYTDSTDFPLNNPLIYRIPNSLYAPNFIAKISPTSTFSITNKIDKTVVSPGGDLHYTIDVTNLSSSPASGTVEVTSLRDRFRTCTVSNGDPCKFVVLGGRASVNIGSLAVGSSRTILIYATAANTAGDYNSITNKATIAGISATAIATVRETADIKVVSSLADSNNGVLHYLHTVTNLGPDNSHAVLLIDQMPPQTTFVSASATAGECTFQRNIGANGAVRCPLNNPDASGSVQVNVVLQASHDACPTITNTTYIASQSIDANPANDFSSVFTQLPVAFCGPEPPPPPSYSVTFLEPPAYQGTIYTNFFLNNKGDLLGPTDLYKAGSTSPISLPVSASGFNDLDDVLALNFANGGIEQGIYKNGQFQAIDFGSPADSTFLYSINNLDEISGSRSLPDGEISFIYENGKTHDVGSFAAGDYARPTGLNNKGEMIIVVSTEDASYRPPLLYTHGLLLKLPGFSADGIDSSGRVTGNIQDSKTNDLYTFLYSGGQFRELSSVGKGTLAPTGINDCGEIVAQQYGGGGEAFLYKDGRFLDLNALVSLPYGLELRATSINNRGQILGTTATPGSFNPTGYPVLLTPAVLEKCGSDATIDNTPNVATTAINGNLITYTITVKNLDTATSHFTVTDRADPTTSLVDCSAAAGTCVVSSDGQSASIDLPLLNKGSTAIIKLTVTTSNVRPSQNVILNTATLSSASTADYLSTAYTSVP